MKHLIILIALLVGVNINSGAQQVYTLPLAAGDTSVDAATAFKLINLTGGYAGVTIKAKATRYSGTMAGNVVLYESMGDGDYRSTGDTIALTNGATDVVYFHKSCTNGTGATGGFNIRYKVALIGSGTSGKILSVKYIPWTLQTK